MRHTQQNGYKNVDNNFIINNLLNYKVINYLLNLIIYEHNKYTISYILIPYYYKNIDDYNINEYLNGFKNIFNLNYLKSFKYKDIKIICNKIHNDFNWDYLYSKYNINSSILNLIT